MTSGCCLMPKKWELPSMKETPVIDAIFLKAPFFGDLILNVEDLKKEFDISNSELAEYEILFSYYDCSGYEGSAFILLRNKKNKDLYEVNAGHCSCYGLEGQFNPEKTSAEFIKFLLDKKDSKFNVEYGLFYKGEDGSKEKEYFVELIDKLIQNSYTKEIPISTLDDE